MKPVNKVLAYITLRDEHGLQVLVFNHRGMPEAGLQVPAGTVEPHESPEEAVLREVSEETGIKDIQVSRLLESFDYYPQEKQEVHHRTYFELQANASLPAQWSHMVSDGKEDKDLVFEFFWMPTSMAASQLAGEQGQAVPMLLK